MGDEGSARDLPPEAAAAALNPANSIGRYVRTCLLGSGGMGEVWKAFDPQVRRWVAVKILPAENEREMARFLREAQTIGQLAHPNIAPIYEVGETGGRPYIAMQYVDGRTLSTIPRHDVRLMARIIRDAARAVQFAHERGIVHRDLKPANIMVDAMPPAGLRADSDAPRVYVMDFGVAKPVAAPAAALTASGALIGTPAYMSPEQARGDGKAVDLRTDIYSLGATLYELLTNQPPFQEKELVTLLVAVVERDPPPVRALNPRIDRDLETITMKCLHKQRLGRYASARELADDLDRWLNDQPIRANPPSTLKRLVRIAGRHRPAAAAAASAAAVTAVFLTVLALRGPAPAPPSIPTPPPQAGPYAPLDRRLNLLQAKRRQPESAIAQDFGRYDDLIAEIRWQMGETGECADGWVLIGRCAEALGDAPRADEAFGRAAALDPRHSRALLTRGRHRIEQALIERAAGWPDARLDEEAARQGAEWIRQGAAASAARSMESDLAHAYLRALDGPWSSAAMLEKWKGEPFVDEFLVAEAVSEQGQARVDAASKVLERAPSWALAYFWRGLGRRQAGDLGGATDDFDAAVKIHPRLACAARQLGSTRSAHESGLLRDNRPGYVAYLRGIQLYFKGDMHAALAAFNEAVRLEPGLAEAWTNRGSVRHKLRDFDGAAADFTEAMRHRTDATDHYNRGNAHMAKGDDDAAIADYSRAIQLDPRRADAFNNRGAVLLRRRDYRGALADFESAIRIEPAHDSARINRGRLRQLQGDVEGALNDFTDVIRQNPSCAAAFAERAGVRIQKTDIKEALEDCEQAIRLDPGEDKGYLYRGMIRLTRGELPGADDDFTRVIALDAGSYEAYANRGLVRLQRKDIAQARADFEKALTLGPPKRERAAIEEYLRRLDRP